ncbi:DUF6415 family natural product biosynthesis protein [Streptomyces sp. MN13]
MADDTGRATAAATADSQAEAGSALVDADTIRQTYEAVLWATRPLTGDQRVRLASLLRGHAQTLEPELAAVEPRMSGQRRRTAVHVLTRARRLLGKGPGSSLDEVWDLATQGRAMQTPLEHPGPLNPGPSPATDDDDHGRRRTGPIRLEQTDPCPGRERNPRWGRAVPLGGHRPAPTGEHPCLGCSGPASV